MQNGDIIQIGSGCPATNDGRHQVEDWCRMCGRCGVLDDVANEAKRYRFIRDKLTEAAKDVCFLVEGGNLNEAIDKEMERMGYE